MKILKKKRCQASLEYMMIIGFSILLFIPLIIMFADEKADLDVKVDANQAQVIARKIADSTESVFYLGEPSKTKLKVYMPNNVQDIYFGNSTLFFLVRTKDQITEIPTVSHINITENISINAGYQYIYIEATENGVLVYN